MSNIRNRNKVRDLEDLREILSSRGDKKVALCHGVFDLLHIGHIRHFNEARRHCDILVVTLTPDRWVNKGPHRPVFSEELRLESLSSLECVDYVALNRWPTAVELIELLEPDLYVKGSEYRNAENDKTGKICEEEEAVRKVGGKILFTDDITFSSSNLLNDFFSPFPDEVSEYLRKLSRRYEIDGVLHYLDQATKARVLVLGETIIDEYLFCETMGKSGKEPILAVRYAGKEKYAGGVLAIANNISSFAEDVSLLSYLGKEDSQEDFIRSQLKKSVKATFLYEDGPTIVKRRYVEQYPFQKLFEVYHMNGCDNAPERRMELRTALERFFPDVDLVLVADYGHGVVDSRTVKLLCEKAPFLAVNTQVNAGNHGFNTIAKYPRADFICISENELRLEARSRHGDIRVLIEKTADSHHCDRALITMGKQGCLCWERKGGFSEIPAFTSKVVDRVGSGDAVLAVASLCAARGAPMEIAGFLGNVAGAISVGTICNKQSLEKVPMVKTIISMLK